MDINIMTILPETIVTVFALGLMLLSAFYRKSDSGAFGYAAIIGLIAAMVAAIHTWGNGYSSFNSTIFIDNYSIFFDIIFTSIGIISVLFSIDYLKREGINAAEYYILVLFSIIGAMLMAGSTNLIVIFIGLEILSFSFYILAGFNPRDIKSEEASIKYFLMGAFGSAILLFGIALFFGTFGSIDLRTASQIIATRGTSGILITLLASLGFMIVGFGFKIAAVPFHMWAPDAYEGAPTSAAALLSTGGKAAGFAALVRILGVGFIDINIFWRDALWIIAAATMVIGNITALVQTNIKRMLAYSTIGHAGYLLIALDSIRRGNGSAFSAVLFYLLTYTFMNIGAFGVITMLGRDKTERMSIDDFKGLATRNPAIAAAMAVFMFSLAGIPPTGGFISKLYVFQSAISAGNIWLAVIGVLTSVVAVYYYLRITVYMYMEGETDTKWSAAKSWITVLALIICVLGILVMGILPGIAIKFAGNVVP